MKGINYWYTCIQSEEFIKKIFFPLISNIFIGLEIDFWGFSWVFFQIDSDFRYTMLTWHIQFQPRIFRIWINATHLLILYKKVEIYVSQTHFIWALFHNSNLFLSDDTLQRNPPNIEAPNSYSSSSNQPNIKVIPISFNNPNQPTVESTTSSIEDILADKVERIAAHLEKANSNILHVDNRIRSFRTEHSKNLETANQQESIQTLTELRDQIDARLKEQAQVNQNLNKSIKSLKNVSEKASTLPATKNNVNPLFNGHHTYPSKSIQFTEDTQTFLDRIRRDADQRVNDALRTVENSEHKNSNNEIILQKLESILRNLFRKHFLEWSCESSWGGFVILVYVVLGS